jgi:hypothetical protein
VFFLVILTVLVVGIFIAAIMDFLELRNIGMFGWRPGESYFSGTGRKKAQKHS